MSFFSKKPVNPADISLNPEAEVPQAEKLDIFENVVPEPAAESVPCNKFPENTTIIGEGTVFTGDIVTSDDVKIDGSVRGDISSSADMTVSGTGDYSGSANMANLTVYGNVQGEINCCGMTTISESGYMDGSLVSSKLTTDPGAELCGSIKLNRGGRDAAKKASAAERISYDEPVTEIDGDEDKPVTEQDIFG